VSWRLFISTALVGAVCEGAFAQDGVLAPGVTMETRLAGEAEIVLVRVDAGGAEVRIVSPQSPAYRPASEDEELCEELAAAVVAVDRAGRQLPRTADLLLRACREQLTQQQPAPVDGLFLIDLVERHTPLVLLSGGYLQSFSPPQALGFVKIAGNQLNPFHRSWLLPGLFCTDGAEWVIEAIADPDTANQYSDCLQAGPFLVQQGRDRYKTMDNVADAEKKLAFSVQEQAFVCLTREEQAILGYSSPMRADRLSALLLDKLGCRDALRLSGHVTAGFWLDGELHGNTEIPLTNAIAVFASD
jgi:hypothetical protein